MKIIVGLGNPTKEYENTRHNVGFMVIDELMNKWSTPSMKQQFKGEVVKVKRNGEDIILLKPLTYMNLSGESLIQVMNFYKVPVEDVLVIYDDLDIPTGKLRLRQSGSAGGHNGIKSIIQHVQTQNFQRLRVGIDRDSRIPVVNYVLGKFTKEEKPLIDEGILQATQAIDVFIDKGFTAAMNQFN